MSTRPPKRSALPFGIGADEAAALDERDMLRLSVVRLVLVLGQHLRTFIDRQLADDGLTTQQAAVLGVVRNLGAPSLGEIARALGTSHQNAKQVAEPLVRKGFLRWTEDPADARKKRLATTAKNTRHWARRNPTDHAEVLALLADLDAADARAVHDRLLLVYRRLQAEHA